MALRDLPSYRASHVTSLIVLAHSAHLVLDNYNNCGNPASACAVPQLSHMFEN